MMPELEADEPRPRAAVWRARIRRGAGLAATWVVGASAVAFWMLVAAHVYLGARPFGRLVWEPPAGVTEVAEKGVDRR